MMSWIKKGLMVIGGIAVGLFAYHKFIAKR